jgi:hypothetical protein
MAMTDELQRLLDEAACRRLLMAYGPALDWRDEATLTRLFWPDAAIDYGFFQGQAKDFIPVLTAMNMLSMRRFHLTAGEVLTHEDWGVLRGQSYGMTQVIAASEGGLSSTIFYGRYLDRFEQRSGEWRFSARRYLLHGSYTAPYQEGPTLNGLLKAEGLDPGHPWFAPP